MKAGKPVIGVTGPERGGYAAWWFIRHAVRRAGGRALRITPNRPAAVGNLDGLIIGGGADIDPRHYMNEVRETLSETRQGKASGFSLGSLLFYPFLILIRTLFSTRAERLSMGRRRDELEMDLVGRAIQRHLPVLGICRGAQLINVQRGGSLHAEIREYYTETPHITTVLPRKQVTLDPESRLAGILGVAECRVNALHHQAVRELGKALRVAAREDNEIIQAIEHESLPFLIGVQWHPEYLVTEEVQKRLFRALVDAARKTVNRKS